MIFEVISCYFEVLRHGKKAVAPPPPPGELGADRLLELLAAAFDWDASLRDPAAALAYLGRRPEEKLSYEEPRGVVDATNTIS